MIAKPTAQEIASYLFKIGGDTAHTWHDAEEETCAMLEQRGFSNEMAAELAESLYKPALNSLAKDSRRRVDEGFSPTVDISGQSFRVLIDNCSKTKSAIARLSPTGFEKFCTALVGTICEFPTHTGKPGDQGVDFMGKQLRLGAGFSVMPTFSRPILLGQAKQYTTKVRESEVREFISGALLRVRELNEHGMFAPVIYAFWTSSDLDQSAQASCRAYGIWYLDGDRLAAFADMQRVDPAAYFL